MKMNIKMMAAAMAVLGAVSCSKSDVFDPGQAEDRLRGKLRREIR